MEKLDLCYKCKKNPAGISEPISFKYSGFDFRVFKQIIECADCAEKRIISIFERCLEGFVKIESERIRVDWSCYFMPNSDKDNTAYVLYALGVLSFSAKGNWEIVSAGSIGLNPRSSMSYLYFTRKEDAVEFARLRFSKVLYDWSIRHIDEVIGRKEVLGE